MLTHALNRPYEHEPATRRITAAELATPEPSLDQLEVSVRELADVAFDAAVIGYRAELGTDGCFRLAVDVTDGEGWTATRCIVIHPDGLVLARATERTSR